MCPYSGEDAFKQGINLGFSAAFRRQIENKGAQRSLGFFRLKGEFAAFFLGHGRAGMRNPLEAIGALPRL